MPPASNSNEPIKNGKHTDGLLERLQKGVVLGAEGYLFEMERRGYLKAGAFVPEVVLDYPDALRELHREFVRCGSEVVVAFTYYAHRDKLRVIGREADLEQLNINAVKIAKEIAEETGTLVAGNICNTWAYNPKDPKGSGKIVREMYDEQVRWATTVGVDFIIAETIEYVEEALIAVDVIKSYGLPAVVTFGPVCEKSKDGYEWIEGCKLLEAKGCDVVGFNCSRGPEALLPLLKQLRKEVKCYIAAQPVAYHTNNEYLAFQVLKDRKDNNAFLSQTLEEHLCTRHDMAEFARNAAEIGVNYIGICCGGAPYHVRSMAEALGRTVPASRYSADFTQHAILGTEKVVKNHEIDFRTKWGASNNQFI